MRYAAGVIAFAVALIVSIMLHELGHFATAKAFGMKATRFFVGFGPTLWSTRRGETEYGVKAIPAGGFVKIVGMTPLEDVEPGDEDRAFYKQPAGRKIVVLAAGSVIHFLIAIFLIFVVIAATHQDPVRSDLRVASVAPCLTGAADGLCTPSDPSAPAAGRLQSGDVIVSVNGRKVTPDNGTLAQVVSHSVGKPVTFVVVRQGARRTVLVTPGPVTVDGKVIGRVGVQNELVAHHVSTAGAVPRTFTTLGQLFTSTVSAIGDLPHEVSVILRGGQRDNGAASVVGIGRVSGQVASADASLGERVATLAFIVAQVNFFVGIFNLLPLLPLDGGHIAIAGYEEARRRAYRRAGRPDPGRVDLMKIMPVTYAVVAVFIGLSLLLLYADIVNPIRIQ